MLQKIDRLHVATLFMALVILICWRWYQADSFPEYDAQEEAATRHYADSSDTWVIGYENAIRKGDYSTPGATNDLLYLPYRISDCVNVYDHHGNFQYAIHFPYRQNGTISVRCNERLAFITDKDHVTYVFDGTKLLDQFRPEEAESNGYSPLWMMETGECQEYDGDTLYITNQFGETLHTIQMPDLTPEPNPMRLVFFVFSLLIYLAALLPAVIGRFSRKSSASPQK